MHPHRGSSLRGYEFLTGSNTETTIAITAICNEIETGDDSELVLRGSTIKSELLDDDGEYLGITLYGASVAIANYKTSLVTLPTTGGMGTVLFYTIGGVLFVGGALLLITKRRAEEFE